MVMAVPAEGDPADRHGPQGSAVTPYARAATGAAAALVLAPAGAVRVRTAAVSAADATPAPRRIRACREILPVVNRRDPPALAPR